MINKNKKSKAIENNDIFIYFSIALVTVVLMLIAPMLNKSIYAKSSTLPANFEEKGKAQQTALTEDSGKALEIYMKPYEDSVNMTKSYQEQNSQYIHNNKINPATQEKNQIERYDGPRINEHKNFLPEGYFWDEGGKKMQELLGPGPDGKIDPNKVKNVNFASELLNPYAGILCFYEGKRLPSGSQLSAQMYKDGLEGTAGTGQYLNQSIFKDKNILDTLKNEVDTDKGGIDGTYSTESRKIETTVRHPDFEFGPGLTNYFGNTGQGWKTYLRAGGGEGLKVGTQRGLGVPNPMNPNVIQADTSAVENAIKTKEEDDKNMINDVFLGNTKVSYIPKDWSVMYKDPAQQQIQRTKDGSRILYTNKKMKNKGSLKYETDEEHDGNYEDITGGHKLAVERDITAIDGAFSAIMAQQYTKAWGQNSEYQLDIIQETKKPGQKGVDSKQFAIWQTEDADHVQHPNAGTNAEYNKAKALKRTAINDAEAKKFVEFVKKYQEYEKKFNEWIEKNNVPRELVWNTDGKTAKVVNHPKEPQIKYILPKGFHQDKEITTKEGEKVKAPNPKYQYQPKIESAISDKSLKEVSKVKFDKTQQKWLIGPYKLRYFSHQLTKDANTNPNDPNKPRPQGFKVGKSDNDNLMSDITEIQLYGVYENDVQNPQKENPNKTDEQQRPIDKIDPNRFDMKASDDAKYKFIKKWRFLTKNGELNVNQYPKSEEEFYFAIDYDPALHKIAKARFVFGYMVQGAKYSKITGTYNVVFIKDAQQAKNKSKTNGNKTGASINGKIVEKKDGRKYLLGKDLNGKDYVIGEIPKGTTVDGTNPIKIENLSLTPETVNKMKESGVKLPDDVSKEIDELLKSDSANKALDKVLDTDKYNKVVDSLSKFKDWGKLDKNILDKLGINLGNIGNLSGISGVTGMITDPLGTGIQGIGGSLGSLGNLGGSNLGGLNLGGFGFGGNKGTKGPVSSVKIRGKNGKLSNKEKYDIGGKNTGHEQTYTNGPTYTYGVKPVDILRNYIPLLNGNMAGRYYSIGGVGSVQLAHHNIPTPTTSGHAGHNEQFGSRTYDEFPDEKVELEYEVEYNVVIQPIVSLDNGAARWGEEIALELEFDHLDIPPTTDTPIPGNPPPNPPTSTPKYPTQLKLPIGGTVWEDYIPTEKKHTGYNNILDEKDKGVAGVRIRIHRNFVKLNSDKSIAQILKKEVARIYRRDTGEEIDQTKEPIISDENGQWGGYDIHDVGFSKQEQIDSNKDYVNYAIIFDVTFDFDGIMYEPVIPLQTEDDKENPNTNIFANNQSIYNSTTTEEKKKYLKSSFAIENFKDRQDYDRKHAEITGGKAQDANLHTEGSAQAVDEQGNRINNNTKLEYAGKVINNGEGTTTRRFESEYQMKSTEGRQLDETYFNDFIEASTLFLGINLPTNEQIVYDNNGYYDQRTGGDSNVDRDNAGNSKSNIGSGPTVPGNKNSFNAGNGGRSNPKRAMNNLTNTLNGNGILPDIEADNKRQKDFKNLGKEFLSKLLGKGSNGKTGGTRVIGGKSSANSNTLWGKMQRAAIKASEILDKVLEYGNLTGTILDKVVDLGVLKKNPLEKVLTKVNKAVTTLQKVVEEGMVTGNKLEELVKKGGNKSQVILDIVNGTKVGNKVVDWIYKKTGIPVNIIKDVLPNNFPENATGEDIIKYLNENSSNMFADGIPVDTRIAQRELGISGDEVIKRLNTLGTKFKLADVKNINDEVNLDEIAKGQEGDYTSRFLSRIANNGKIDSTNLEKTIEYGMTAASILDELAKTGSININIAGANLRVSSDVKDMLNQILQQSGIAGTAISDLINNGKIDMKNIWEKIKADGGFDIGIWENIIKSGDIDTAIWQGIGGGYTSVRRFRECRTSR